MPTHTEIADMVSSGRKWRASADRLILPIFAKIHQNGPTAKRRRLRPLGRQETFAVSTGTQMSCFVRSDARNTPVAPPFTRIYILFTASIL